MREGGKEKDYAARYNTPLPPRSGTRSKHSVSSSSGGGSLSSSTSPDITLSCGMSVFVNKEMGAVRFIGNTEFAEGVWLGVELRKPCKSIFAPVIVKGIMFVFQLARMMVQYRGSSISTAKLTMGSS